MTMPTLTIWQPWATLIVEGFKPYEFRGDHIAKMAHAHVGKRIAVHAGARKVRVEEVSDLISRLQSSQYLNTGLIRRAEALQLLERVRSFPGSLPLSSVLCTAMLGAPIRDAELARQLGTKWTNDSDRDEHSNWGLPLTEIEPVIPRAPARGARGFWSWTANG
jgi:hypothetical protein